MTVKPWLATSCASMEYKRRVVLIPGEKRTTGQVSFGLQMMVENRGPFREMQRRLVVTHKEQRWHPQLMRWLVTYKILFRFYNRCLEEEGRNVIS